MATEAQARVESALATRHSWISNHEVEGRGGQRPVVSPSSGRPFAQVSLLDAEQMGAALEAAGRAFPAWAGLGFRARGRHLLALRQALLDQGDALAELIAREQGKPSAEAHLVELFPSLEALKHMARHAEDLLKDDALESQVLLFAHKHCRLVYNPLGVVLVITPWNYPLSISLISVATALAAGNTVVLKPAPATTLIGLEIGRLCREVGLPAGVVNVVAVDDALAPALVQDARVAKIVFTGSVATGKRVMAAAAQNLTPVVLELGGKDPAIVCKDADLERAAAGIVWGAFVNSGQTCASVERVYVEQEVAEEFVRRVVAETNKLRQGDPLDPEVDLGPLTMERQRLIVEEHVKDAVQKGARVLTGGQRPDGPGYFYPPTVLTHVDHSMRIMREETFGPVLPIMTVASVEEGLRLANDSEYGLTASGWTRDGEQARRLGQGLRAGVVTINDCVASFGEPTAPWGGLKHSGIGRTHGLLGLREMVQATYVSEDFSRGRALWWFPYGAGFRRTIVDALFAVHQRSLLKRLKHQARLVASRRFLGRVSLLDVLAHLDKLF